MTEELLEKEYYDYQKTQGIDYNYYGNWQKKYAKMIISISDQIEFFANNQKDSLLLDVGTACGVNLLAFKETKTFKDYIGIDKNSYMINLGRNTHGFTDEELIINDITKESLPLLDDSVHLIHCSQMLEHIDPESIEIIFDEFKRVLHPEGSIIINVPAIKPGQKKGEALENDIHHINMQSLYWWKTRISNTFNGIDTGITKRFKEDKHSPNNTDKSFYDYYNKSWNFFQFSK